MPSFPHHIYGVLRDKNGTALTDQSIILTNTRTGDTQTVTTNSKGRYLIDCASFTNGYENNDAVTATLNLGYDEDDFELYISINDGNTWSRVANDTNVTMRYNRGRVKIDTTNYTDGRTDLELWRC